MTTTEIHIRQIPVETYARAKARAAAEGRHVQGLIGAALREYAAGTWTPAPSGQARPED